MTAPVHLPSCRCGGAGVIEHVTTVESSGTAAARKYSSLADCPGQMLTDDNWRSWQTGQLAAGKRTQTDGGVINRQAGLDGIAAARKHLPARPTTEPTP